MKNRLYLPGIACLSSLLLIPSAYASSTPKSSNNPASLVNHNSASLIAKEGQTSLTGVVSEVNRIAKEITVRINSRNNGNGSGALVAKQGQTYYVLTAAHMVTNEDQYQVVTPDGQQYPVSSSTVTLIEGVDLAVVQFTSTQTYSVATLANYDLDSSWVFVSGFSQSNTNQSQRLLTAGKVFSKKAAAFVVKDSFSLTNGYGLVYTNVGLAGMGGSPVLDRLGRVVGISAATESEIEINKEGQPIELNIGYSLGVPIATFLNLATKGKIKPEWLKVATSQPPALTYAEETALLNELVTLPVPSKNADAFAWLNYGNHLWRAFQYDKAVVAFDEAIQLKPDFYQAYYAKGLSLFEGKKHPEALVAFEQATNLAPNFYPAWRWRGKTLSQLQKYSEAFASYVQAIKINPKDFVLRIEQGDTLRNLKRYPEAITAYSEAIKINVHPVAYNNRGLAYFALKEYPQAIADYNKAIELQPDYDSTKAYSNRCKAYLELKDYQKAIADCSKAIEIQPDNEDGYINRLLVYSALKDYQKALADINKLLELASPDNLIPYYYRGTIYGELKEYQKAIAEFTRVINLQPDYAEAYYNRGLIYSELKDKQKAIADIQKAVQLFYQQGNMSEYQLAQDFLRKLQSNK